MFASLGFVIALAITRGITTVLHYRVAGANGGIVIGGRPVGDSLDTITGRSFEGARSIALDIGLDRVRENRKLRVEVFRGFETRPDRWMARHAVGRHCPEAVPMGGESDWAEGHILEARVPLPAELTLLRDGEPLARVHGTLLEQAAERPGTYRLEARLHANGARRTWILSNPVYLR